MGQQDTNLADDWKPISDRGGVHLRGRVYCYRVALKTQACREL